MRLLAALRAVGQEHLAEVEKLVRLYLDSKDSLEPVPAKELMQRAKKGLVTVLDVRPPEEYAAGHIRGAINVPITELKKRLKEIPRGQEIVAYCRGPYCLMAFEAVAELRKQGPQGAAARWRLSRVEKCRAAGRTQVNLTGSVESLVLSRGFDPRRLANGFDYWRARQESNPRPPGS